MNLFVPVDSWLVFVLIVLGAFLFSWALHKGARSEWRKTEQFRINELYRKYEFEPYKKPNLEDMDESSLSFRQVALRRQKLARELLAKRENRVEPVQ